MPYYADDAVIHHTKKGHIALCDSPYRLTANTYYKNMYFKIKIIARKYISREIFSFLPVSRLIMT